MVDKNENATEVCSKVLLSTNPVAYDSQTGEVSIQPVASGDTEEITPENSRVPCRAYCEECKKFVTTNVEMEVGTYANLCCCLICLLGGGVLCLCYIAYCKDSFLDAVHTCPSCEEEIGTCKRYEC